MTDHPSPPPEAGTNGAAKKSPVWPTILAVGISVALLGWALRGVHFDELMHHVRNARIWPIIGAVAVATSLFPLRVFRWRLLLRYPDGRNLSWGDMWHPVAMGFMANNILPFRAGEVVRIFSVSKLGGVGLGASLSSLAVERIFDGLALVLLMTIALFTSGIPQDLKLGSVSLGQAATFAGIAGAAALLAAIMVVAFPRPAERLVRLLVPAKGLAEKLVRILEDLRHGMAALRSPGRMAGVALWSVVLWLINGFSFYVAFYAFGIPVDFSGALLLQSVLALGIAVPSAPGYVGVFEAAILLILGSVYGISDNLAVAYALTYHVTTFLPITLMGLWSVGRTGLGLRSLRQAAIQPSE